MGKAARKLKKRQDAVAAAEIQQANRGLEDTLRQQMEDGQYEKVIDTLAELIQAGDVKPEFMYDAAYAYFMAGDYDRSATWVNNTLAAEPGNIPVRILLARLLILNKREDDGLAVFDFVLDKGQGVLSQAQLDEIEEIVEFYGRNDREKVLRSYPHVAKLLKLEDAPQPKAKSAASLLASLKQKVAAASAAAEEAAQPHIEAVRETVQTAVEAAKPVIEEKAAAVKSPADLLQSLKQRIAEASGKTAPEPAPEAPAVVSAPEPTPVQPVVTEVAEQEEDEAERLCNEVLERDIFPSEKAKALSMFAASFYYKGDIESAEFLLEEAMKLDTPTDAILRNMALVQKELGETEKALEYAAKMSEPDFLVLKELRK